MYGKERVAENIAEIKKQLAGRAELLAATKNVGADMINFAASKGIKIIGENRVNELLGKYALLDREALDIHFIGRLQTNKVKYIIDKVSLIHSVDSEKLAAEIDRRAYAKDLRMDVLVELNLGGEPSKGGIDPDEAGDFIDALRKYNNVRVRGLMAIPPISGKKGENNNFFKKINQKFIDIRTKNVDNGIIDILSAGMSGDYLDAVENGSTIVRIGSALFGGRS